jgi:hypothetical protein
MPASTVTPTTSLGSVSSIGAVTTSLPTAATCSCGGAGLSSPERARRLLQLDRAVDAGLVTPAEAAERRVQLLSR